MQETKARNWRTAGDDAKTENNFVSSKCLLKLPSAEAIPEYAPQKILPKKKKYGEKVNYYDYVLIHSSLWEKRFENSIF